MPRISTAKQSDNDDASPSSTIFNLSPMRTGDTSQQQSDCVFNLILVPENSCKEENSIHDFLNGLDMN